MVLKLSFQSWDQIDWSLVERTVKSYRYGIFLGTKSGDLKRVNYLQNRVLHSKSVLLWAIRRVTLINKGRKTSGIDRFSISKDSDRFALFEKICLKGIRSFKPLPVKRIYILKSNGKLRPLGIPVIIDRVIQDVTRIALEPQWEAKFEHCSYGFRPARSCHDAMIRVYKTFSRKRKTFILEGDISGCFDNISHDALLSRLEDFPGKDLVAGWLKAGYMSEGKYFDTLVGTPQGGIISPLLANIALHGMEEALGIQYTKLGSIVAKCPYTLVRYADDFVVLCTSLAYAEQAKQILSVYLAKMGLVLSPEKTFITAGFTGFDFLGWNFRLFVDKHKRSGLVTLVRPSVKSIQIVKEKMRTIWRSAVGTPIASKIRDLNSIIIGWANYHRYVNSGQIFRALDHFNYLQAVRFARRQHPMKSWSWLVSRYFTKVGLDRWCFYDNTLKLVLKKFRTHKILRFLPIKYGFAPDDESLAPYFESRKRKNLYDKFKSVKSMLFMLESQSTLCPVCGETLAPDVDNLIPPDLHVHHLVSRSVGGKNTFSNLMVLHSECHRFAHRKKLSRIMLITSLKKALLRSNLPSYVLVKFKWGNINRSVKDKTSDVADVLDV